MQHSEAWVDFFTFQNGARCSRAPMLETQCWACQVSDLPIIIMNVATHPDNRAHGHRRAERQPRHKRILSPFR